MDYNIKIFKVKEAYDKFDFHDKPLHIFCCDEFSFQCDCEDEAKVVFNRNSSAINLENFIASTFSCSNATGDYLPVLVIYKGKDILSNWRKKGPSTAFYDKNETGWIEGEQFVRWFKLVFLKHCETLDGHKILFIEDKASYITLELIELARDNNVILFRLPSHASHSLKQLNLDVFKLVKESWPAIFKEFLEANFYKNLTKENFSAFIKVLAECGFKKEMTVEGFKEKGLLPLNEEKMA